MAKYIVTSPAGTIHSVNDEDVMLHMTQNVQAPRPDDGFGGFVPREATPDEIAAWWAAQGLVYDPASDTAHAPVAEPADEAKPKTKPAAAEK